MTTYAYTIELTDYTFIALENLLNEQCRKMKEESGIDAFDPITGEPRHTYGVILNEMKRSISTAVLNSTSSFIPKNPTNN